MIINAVDIGSRVVRFDAIDFEMGEDGEVIIFFLNKKGKRLATPEATINLEALRRFCMFFLSAIEQHPIVRIVVEGGTVQDVAGLYENQEYIIDDRDEP